MISEAIRIKRQIRKCVEWESNSQELNSKEYLHLKDSVEREANKKKKKQNKITKEEKPKRMPLNPRRNFFKMEVLGTVLNFAALKIKGRKAAIAFSNREFSDLGKSSVMEK